MLSWHHFENRLYFQGTEQILICNIFFQIFLVVNADSIFNLADENLIVA